MEKHCCQRMESAINLSCELHGDIYSCPDVLISYTPKFDEYGLIIHDVGSASIAIIFCPWCGTKLPESKRNLWFDELEKLGFDEPDEQKIPNEYTSDAWYRNT